MAYFMMFLNMVTLAPILSMPTLIAQGLIMKLETSEKLYSEGAYIVAFLIVNMTLSLVGLLLLIIIMFAMGKLPWSAFGNLLNGFALTKISAPPFLKWVFYISPVSYSMEDIAHFNYGSDPTIWKSLVEYNGLEWTESTVFWGTA